MYKVTLTYVLKKRVDDDAIQKVWSVVGAYLHTGQLMGTPWVTRGTGPFMIRATAITHERSALSRRFRSKAETVARAELAPLLRRCAREARRSGKR